MTACVCPLVLAWLHSIPLHGCPSCRHPAVLKQLRSSGERMLLLGHRSKDDTVEIPEAVQDVVVVLESLPYTVRCGAARQDHIVKGLSGCCCQQL